MCTTAAKRIDSNWYLMKTRDPVSWMRWDDEIKLFAEPEDKLPKLIVQNPVAHEDGFYGGINSEGVAVVATYVKVAQTQISYLRKPYIRLILDATTAAEAVAIVEQFNPRIGGNIFIADPNKCYLIEASPQEYNVVGVESMDLATNHFRHLPYKNLVHIKDPREGEWSQTHYSRAKELLENVEDIEDMQSLLRDRKNAEKGMAICTTGAEDLCYTHSAMIFDCQNKKAYYAQGNPLEVDFKEYGFN